MGRIRDMVLQLFAARSVKAASAAAAAQNKFLSLAGLTSFLTHSKATFAGKSRLVSASLPASGWAGTDTHTITINVSGVTADTLVEIMVAETAATAQKTAWAEAGIVSGSTGAGTVSLEAIGEVPEVDIPVTLIIRGD
ncbi:MAG TPA: hypothetical protein IAA06_13255 [Candidatus Blautia faecavium]|uniref:Uncharacterized protein n=1 Tax=Candidatus Blautia faecavium TaxID=2838487 RepID=A0A9D2LU89_9FIRM|nr:hypothetical protein [Candidatus Blautia faecavium]